ncbi:MAG: Carbamoyl-phosphate synthase chain ATP-binding protein [Myxococcales bacterium]|nr:Carbamoyl-phosphate synthase chain ATP-binding protein [Myxococcales bacterium]
MPPIKKILIANRGEIAVRVMRACRELGIKTVAIYSDADRGALHVRTADEAYPVGPPPARESYLDMAKVLDAAKKSGADAIHPGYGFLSEKADFARACAAAGVTFIGPPADAIDAMGDKTRARQKMMAAGVPVVPGDNGPTGRGFPSAEAALESARKIGLPVMLKASAGGGGKGMRLVEDEKKFIAAYQGAQREAQSAFGDDAVYLEKAVIRPRHVEIQVFADAHGNTVHLFERDCSIQRRHQKVIEEAPSPAVTPELRAKMGAVAVKAAAAVNYVGAGTCEFLLSEDGNFYFLEMNTRLQVEHPVTEMITQRDLVRLQIAIASGEKLPFKQEDLKVHGAAIECRIYAEDPIKFLPSPGKILQYRQPTGPYVRDDSGVYEGAEISVFYDPMISKLITWGATRAEAIERMERALKEYRVGGIKTNLAFHRRVLREPDFRAGKYSTAYIEAHKELLSKPMALDENEEALDAALTAAALHTLDAAPQLSAGNGHAAAATQSSSVERTGWQRSLGFTGG